MKTEQSSKNQYPVTIYISCSETKALYRLDWDKMMEKRPRKTKRLLSIFRNLRRG